MHSTSTLPRTVVAAIESKVAPVVTLVVMFSGTCPQCQRRRALKTTGNEKKEEGWFKTTEQEWHCRHCGYTVWRKKPSGGGGFLGCSGGGGGGCGG